MMTQATSNNSHRRIPPQIHRTSPNMHNKIPLLNHILHLPIPQPPLSHIQLNTNIHRLTRLDHNLLEALELLVGHYDTSEDILNLDLHYFLAIHLGFVRYGKNRGDGVAGADFGLGECDVGVSEVRVGEAVAEFV